MHKGLESGTRTGSALTCGGISDIARPDAGGAPPYNTLTEILEIA